MTIDHHVNTSFSTVTSYVVLVLVKMMGPLKKIYGINDWHRI